MHKRLIKNHLIRRRLIYETAKRKVIWLDTATFYIDVPGHTVINIADVSNGLTLGSKQIEVLLLLISDDKTDTLMKGDYLSLANKFKTKGYNSFSTVIYYYDFR